MPTLVLPAHVQQRPTWPFGINWNSWEAQGLKYWLPAMPSQRALVEMVSQTNQLTNTDVTQVSFNTNARVPLGLMREGYRFTAPLELNNLRNVDLGGLSGAMTLSLWCMQFVATAATQRLFYGMDTPTFAFSGLFINNTQHWQGSRTWTAVKSRTANEVLVIGQLYHVVMTDDASTTGANMHLYVNGRECGYSATSNATAPATTTTALPLSLAGRAVGGGQAFSGSITDVRVYNYQMTDTEVQRLYSRAPNFDLYYIPNRLVFSVPSTVTKHQQFLPLLGVA